jgi:hypothetical protein
MTRSESPPRTRVCALRKVHVDPKRLKLDKETG